MSDMGTDNDLGPSGRAGAGRPPRRDHSLDPVYRQTRVEPANPGVLLDNKIFSLLHGGVVSDEVKLLRTQVLQRLEELGGNSLLVTSARPGEGKTFTAVNLAVSIAHEVSRTALLVDADIRKPSIHERFGLGNPAGLSDYLVAKAEVAQLLVNPGLPRLTLLPAGNSLDNSAELLGSPRMGDLVDELKHRYPDRVLVFDSPSLLTTADALVFSRQVDGVLLVVEAERTARADVARALELLGGCPIVGLVYNKSRDKR